MPRGLHTAAAGLLLLAGPLAAQQPTPPMVPIGPVVPLAIDQQRVDEHQDCATMPARRLREGELPYPWRFRLLPYPTYDPEQGFALNLNTGWAKPASPLPPPISLQAMLDARISTSGTRGVTVRYDAPGWWCKWRLLVVGGAERLTRVPYYGLGNNSAPDPARSNDYYRYELDRFTGLVVLQRRLWGHLRAHVAVQVRHYNPTSNGDSTQFAVDVASGVLVPAAKNTSEELRLGLVFDTRNEEASPTHGVFLEAMGSQGVGEVTFTRWLFSAREFIPFGEFDQWVLALRQTAELSADALPVFIAYERLTTWYPEDGFAGPTSLRLYETGRFVAANRTLASVDLRKKLIDIPIPTAPVRLWGLAFADVGRLWNPGEDPTLDDLHWSVGIGARLQAGKGLIFGIDIGRNDEAFGFGLGTSFAF